MKIIGTLVKKYKEGHTESKTISSEEERLKILLSTLSESLLTQFDIFLLS